MATPAEAIPAKMAGIVIEEHGGPEKLKYSTELPVPVPKEGEVLVKNEYIGVNYIDTYFRSGLYPAPLPLITGKEAAGTVVSVGPSSSASPGDRVAYILDHTYAAYSVVPAAHLLRIPPSVPTSLAASSLLQGLTALTFVSELPVAPGSVVVVMASAGGVGQWLVQILCSPRFRCTVIATAGTAEKVSLALSLGARYGVNYRAEDPVSRIRSICQDELKLPLGGPDVIFDGVGRDTFDGDLEVVGRKGTLVIYGNASGPVPPLDLLRLGKKNVRLLRPVLFGYIATEEERERYATELWGLLERGEVKVGVHEIYPLAEARRAHEYLEGRKTTGKLLLKV